MSVAQHLVCVCSLRTLCCFMPADVEEFLSKKTELNNMQLRRQHELYISFGQVPIIPQVHNKVVAFRHLH